MDQARANSVYVVVGTQELSDCALAAVGEIRALFQAAGCSQIVRGTLYSHDDRFVVTGGIINLETADLAVKVYNDLGGILRSKSGRMTGYSISSEDSTKALNIASTAVGWDVHGHYVAYCVIARVDRQPSADNDPNLIRIMNDIVELYLEHQIIMSRA